MKSPEYYDEHPEEYINDLHWCPNCEKIIVPEEIDNGFDGSEIHKKCGSLIHDLPESISNYILISYHWKDAFIKSNKLNDKLYEEIESLKIKVKKINQILEESVDNIKKQF